MSHPFGQPLNVIKFNDATSVEFNKAELEGLLLHPEVKNRKVVIMSIVGAFRKGKSFFMDYCLRFLYANVSFCLKNVYLLVIQLFSAVQVDQKSKQSAEQQRRLDGRW